MALAGATAAGGGARSVAASSAVGGSGMAAEPSGHHVYRVPSGSMEPTLGIGARVIVSAGRPAVGAIVVFHPPVGFETEQCGPRHRTIVRGHAACAEPAGRPLAIEAIKRVVAGPGDELYIRRGTVYRKPRGSHTFVRQPDPYARACGTRPECDLPVPITVPAGHWYLLGDNRGESDDSRFFGPIPSRWVVGVVTRCASAKRPAKTLGQQMGIDACRLRTRHR